MTKVIHQCPGAEQTMSMTGFDLAAMERAVGMLCDDITGNFLTFVIKNPKQCMMHDRPN